MINLFKIKRKCKHKWVYCEFKEYHQIGIVYGRLRKCKRCKELQISNKDETKWYKLSEVVHYESSD